MKFTATLAAFLGATAALARPNLQAAASRPRHRSSGVAGKSGPGIKSSGQASSANTIYFDNWSGAISIGTGYNYVRGTIVVPEIHVPPGGDPSNYYAAVIWVGIDGDLDVCPNGGLIQTGVEMGIQNGQLYYNAWHEWWPEENIIPIDNFPVNVGDTVRMSVWAYTPTSGMVMVENLTSGQQYSYQYSGITGPSLCMETAEWIVEDYGLLSGGLVPFANFTTVTFTDAFSNKGGVSGATIVDIEQNGRIYTDCSDNSNANTVTCRYI